MPTKGQSGTDNSLRLTPVQLGISIAALVIGITMFFVFSRDSDRELQEQLRKPVSRVESPALRPTEVATTKTQQPQSLVKRIGSALTGYSGIDSQIAEMMNAIDRNDSEQVERLALKVQEANTVKRGDRKNARKANDEGLAALQRGDLTSAITSFEDANRLDASDQEILNNLGYAIWQTGDLPKAAKIFQKTLLINPRRTSAWANLSQVLAKMGDEKESVAAFLLAFNFSKDRVKTLEYLEKFMATDQDEHTQKVVRTIKERTGY